MILRIFRSNQPYTVFFTALLSISAGVLAYFLAPNPSFEFAPIAFLVEGLIPDSALFRAILIVVLLFTGATRSDRLYNGSEFDYPRHYLAGMWYILLFLPAVSSAFSVPILLANLFAITAIKRLLLVFRQPRALAEYFETGFWLGLASLAYLPYWIIFVPVLLAILFTRTFKFQEFTMPLVGAVIPWFYLISIRFISDASLHGKGELLVKEEASMVNMHWSYYVLFTFLFIFLIYSTVRYLKTYLSSSNKSKNTKSVFLILLPGIILSAWPVYYGYFELSFLTLILAVPVLLSLGSYRQKKDWLPKTLLSLLLLSIIYILLRDFEIF